MIRIVVSACLLGAPVRPDGSDKRSNHPILQRWLEDEIEAADEFIATLEAE